jgi:hypothetical protein
MGDIYAHNNADFITDYKFGGRGEYSVSDYCRFLGQNFLQVVMSLPWRFDVLTAVLKIQV